MSPLVAVIVFYVENPQRSTTLISLRAVLAERPQWASRLVICFYDNTPAPLAFADDLFFCETLLFQPGANMGLPAAYNAALRVAEQRRAEWLLLLDSDTELTAAYFDALEAAFAQSVPAEVGAFVPQTGDVTQIHSPRYARLGRREPVPRESAGLQEEEVIALNSGAVVRVKSVAGAGGFNTEFFLDYLDYWLFRSLYRSGLRIYVLPVLLSHALSLADPVRNMPLDRYRHMLNAERLFFSRYGSLRERLRLKLVLLKRMFQFAVQKNGIPYAEATWETLL